MSASGAYYNEIDPYAAQWLRNLIAAGHIAPGDVDERSIEDVYPDDLRGYTQCHFFAGIGVWSYALRRAGWPDDRPVWTGSCPCQPFSAAGKGVGFADERHLWPAWQHFIAECGPPIIFGEQVASKNADPWIDLVQDDMEALGYAFGAVPFPSASVGAPHIRDRLYWVADASNQRRQRVVGKLGTTQGDGVREVSGQGLGKSGPVAGGAVGGVADANGWDAGAERQQRGGEQRQQPEDGGAGGMADAAFRDQQRHGGIARGEASARCGEAWAPNGNADRGTGSLVLAHHPGPTNGLWATADWLFCRDGKWRPVEPGAFPLAHGASSRVGRLRAYGNAIVAQAAQVWIETFLDVEHGYDLV